MLNNKSFELQNQIRQQGLQTHEKLKDLKSWEIEMKEKEAKMKKELDEQQQQQAIDQSQKSPVRSKIEEFQKFGAAESMQKMKPMSIDDDDNKVCEEENVTAVKTREAAALKAKGNAFVSSKDYESAIKIYSRAIELCNDDPVFYSNRSSCYLNMAKYKECIKDADKAIELDPKYVKAHYRRMCALEKSGEDFKAIQTCQKLLELTPADPLVHSAYDRLHNRIMEAERKKDKEKIRWSRLSSSAKLTNFVTKPPHLRSKRPMKNVPVRLHKAPSPIPEAIIDRIFMNNTGENVPEPETDSKLFKPNFLLSPTPLKVTPPKVAKVESPKCQLTIANEKENIDETNANLKEKESQKQQQLQPMAELESQKNHLITIPKTGPQFYAAWKELRDVQRFLYLKNIADNNAHVGKLLGAQLNSEMLSEIISIVHRYFTAYNVPYTQLLSDLGKNSEVSLLSMFLEDDEKKKLNELLAVSCSSGDNAMNNQVLEIKQCFQI